MGAEKLIRAAGALVDDVISHCVSAVKVLKRSDGEKLSDSPESLDFTYIGTDCEGEYVGKMFYADSYFEKPSTEYNSSLATASIALAMSCGNSDSGYECGFRNAESLMNSMGFTAIEHNRSYETLSSLNTIGVIIGSKTIGAHTLLCMGIRGIGYGSEWGSNLILGTGIYHQGFDDASNRALEFLKEYLDNHSVSGEIKLWITGYSRSASTTNLVAGKIDTALAENRVSEMLGDSIELCLENIYAYCFEPAETVEHDAFDIHGPDYQNIWNHINPNDPIPIMVTACFGMERFGTDLVFPSERHPNYRERRDRMLDFYNRLPNRKQIGIYRSDMFRAAAVKPLDENINAIGWKTQIEFLADFNRKLSEYLGSREFYVENLQSGLSEYVARRNAYEGSEKFKQCFRQALGDNKLSVVSALLSLGEGDAEGVRKSMRKPVTEAVKRAALKPEMIDELTLTVSELLMIFRGFIHENRLMTFNFIFNAKTIFFAHYPELIFAWLMSNDSNYRK